MTLSRYLEREEMKRVLLAMAAVFSVVVITMPKANNSTVYAATKEKDTIALYNKYVDYMDNMIDDVIRGDMQSLQENLDRWNIKSFRSDPSHEFISAEYFIHNFERYSGFSLEEDYIATMQDMCVSGNVQGGLNAERKMKLREDAVGVNETSISFADLYLLSKIITAEAGSSWLPIEWKMMVGEVLLNRVASPEFPNTIKECLYQPGQYYGVGNKYFESLVPNRDSVEAATRLLLGERVINDPSVVFQANFVQGSGVCVALYDDVLGYTYFCYSNYPNKY